MMYSRRFKLEILRRIELLETQYKTQEQQVQNLLQILKEYRDELDRRHNSYNKLLLATRTVAGVGVLWFLGAYLIF